MDKTPSPRGGSRIAPSKNNGARVALIVAAVVIVAIFAVAAWWCGFYSNIYPGVSVAGIDVGGMSVEDATAKIAEALSNEQGTVTISNGGETIASFDTADIRQNFDVQTEASSAAKYAYDAVRENGIGAKLGAMFGRKTELMLEGSTDASALSGSIASLCGGMTTGVVDGSWKVQAKSNAEGDDLIISAGSAGIGYDAAALSAEVERRLIAGEFGDLDISAYAATVEPKPVDLDAVYKELHVEPQDAKIIKNEDTGEMDVQPEVIGYDFDLAAAKKQLESGADFTVLLKRSVPEVTEEQLRATMFEDLLAECFTTMENKRNYDRTGNVKLAADAINGTILMPGEEFSYNGTVGERTAERGYKKASVYLSGGIEDQLGGGICQTSSTLYMAVIRARLEVTQRKPHKYSVGYTPLGEDATVYWGSLDFKFKNNRDYPVKIVAWQEGYDITVQIWGTDVDGYKVEISHVTHSYTPYSTVEVENPELDYGKTRQKVQGHSAYSVTTYATVTDKDGNEVDKYKVADSKYVLLNRVLEVGTKGAPASTSPEPSTVPAVDPTALPSTEPTPAVTATPPPTPTTEPTAVPTAAPTPEPTFTPATSVEPTPAPTPAPTPNEPAPTPTEAVVTP